MQSYERYEDYDREKAYNEANSRKIDIFKYDNAMEALKEIMDELYDNTIYLNKNKLHDDLLFLCDYLGLETQPYTDIDLLSIDHYKEKYKYTGKRV